MAYKYKAYTRDKKVVQGTIEVATESLAEGALYSAGYERVLSLTEVSPGLDLRKLLPSLFGVRQQEVIEFSNQLATLIESGISIVTALHLLGGQASKKALRKTISGLIDKVQGGSSLSEALSHYPQAFPDTFCRVIKASEQAGNMETGLREAASYMEKQATANQKIRRAMAYPIFLLLMAVGVTILLISVALPPLVDLFKSIGAKLPGMTTFLINVAGFLTSHSVYVAAGIFAIIILIIMLLRLPSVKLVKDRFLLTMPLIGVINIERIMQRFCQTASMMLKAGLRLPQIMDIAIETNRNLIVREAFGRVRDRLIQGEGLAQPMADDKLFPPVLVEMVVVGENTGNMDSTLATLASFYEKKVERRIDILISMIEPALTLVIGGVVIFIALSLITPLYSILGSMH
jgi:type IV pilus assembly protein PilC